MQNKTIYLALLLLGLQLNANETFRVSISDNALTTKKISYLSDNYLEIKAEGYESEKNLGAPDVPVKSWLVVGKPEDLAVKLKILKTKSLIGKPYPTQEQDCRCDVQKVKRFQYNKSFYENSSANISVHYLGAHRGTPITRIDLRLGTYNSANNTTELITQAEVKTDAQVFSFKAESLNDYLIIAPHNLISGVDEFVQWKRSKGYSVYVESISAPANTTAAIQSLIKNYYSEKGIDFVILVGAENVLPMFRVSTSGSYQTPSDLSYFTMDGANDHIPDIYSSRLAASTADEVKAQLAKTIEMEQKSYANSSGLNSIIGIASNEGSSPSDDEYVTSIEEKFQSVLNSNVLHLYQDDSVNSKPSVLNNGFNQGASWLTYLGHGSGSSWPSMYQTYSVSHIPQMDNRSSVKPIIIDVACQNGRLMPGYLGTGFMKAQGSAFGAVAYYGGSVNISWHPPAIMARGIAFEHLSKKFNHLGEALLAGQLYLASSWNNDSDVIDNFEWYHLQGDPGLNISF